MPPFFSGSGQSRRHHCRASSSEPQLNSSLCEHALVPLYLPLALTCALSISKDPSTLNRPRHWRLLPLGHSGHSLPPGDYPVRSLHLSGTHATLIFLLSLSSVPPSSPLYGRLPPAVVTPPLSSSGQATTALRFTYPRFHFSHHRCLAAAQPLVTCAARAALSFPVTALLC